MAEKVNLQQKIQQYRQANPKLKNLSDEKILSIMVKNGVITLTEEEQRSVFGNNKPQNNNMGLQVEKNGKKTNPQKTIYLQSGRKVVYSKTPDGKLVMKYYGTDGTQLNPDYFKKVEGQISISEDGKTYTITKDGKKTTLRAKDPSKGAIGQNLARLNNEEKRLKKTKKEQGGIGKSWDWIKNTTGIGDGSDKAQKQIEAERKLLNQIKTGKISKKDFKEVTGVEYSKENLEKFKRGELSQATAKIDGYKEGQEMASDVAGDMISGIAAVGIYTAAVAAAPFTGGVSIAVGIAAATASGALIKAGVKALDTVGTDRKYTLKDFGHDCVTGAFSGALAPITGGLGGAVGKTVATKLGIQAVKQVGKEVAETVVETGVKQGVKEGIKTALVNPTGYEYIGGTLVKRAAAMSAEMATDGALGGAIDGGFRAGLDNDWDANAILSGTVEGGIGGALMAPIIGGGFKAVGKGGHKLGEKIKGGKEASEVIEDIVGKQVAESAEEVSPKAKVEETTKTNGSEKQGKTLEGGVKDTELDEVAPFAQHLTEEKHIGDIVVPNKENVEIVNGDFVNGEFVPDGSVTIYAHGNNPLNKKSFTWQRTSYPSFLVAQNKKELTQQILDILGDKKINKYKIKEIDEILQKNPELEISDLSEILGYLNNIGHARHFIQQGLSSVKDFKLFKANVKNYGEFLYQLEHANYGYQIRDISGAKFEEYRFDRFMNFIESIDSESFEANCNAFLNMRGYFKDYLHPKDFLSTVHDKKCLERIQILDDFNYEHTDWSRTSEYNKVKPFYNLDVLSDDKKFAELLERIGKRYLGSNSDTGHASLSAEYVYSILDRFKLSDDMKDRIISIVENHHWFKDFNNGVMDERTIATLARRPQDWLIYKIMAKADLVNVSEDFAIKHVKGATTIDDLSQAFDKQVATIEEQIKKLREKQVVVTSTQWVDVPERVKLNGNILEARTFGRKTAEIDGVETEFKVLNLNEIADDEDMFKYGFNHLKRKDLRFIIHMPGDGSTKWFNVFKTLAQNPLNNSAQSLSMISVDNANISHAYYSNTGSGTDKGLQNFVHELFEDGHHRSYVKDQFVDFLKTERGVEIDDNAYAKITEYIMNKKFPETQLKGNFTIDGKIYKADDILDAFTFSRDQLIKETKEKTHGSHNEMVGLNAKVKGLIAKVNTFEELPEYFLRFAKENNLPIILMRSM